MDEGNTEEFVDATWVAHRAGVSRWTVIDWWQAGLLPGYRLGHRTIRFARTAVEAFLAARRVESR